MDGPIGSLHIAAKYIREIHTIDPAVDKELREIAARLQEIAATIAGRQERDTVIA